MEREQFVQAFGKLEDELVGAFDGLPSGPAEDRSERRQQMRADIRYRTLLIFNDLISSEIRDLALFRVRKTFSSRAS
jgi:hypothetical protein